MKDFKAIERMIYRFFYRGDKFKKPIKPVGKITDNLTGRRFMVKHPTHKYLEHQWHYIHHRILFPAIDLFSTPANQIVAHKVPK